MRMRQWFVGDKNLDKDSLNKLSIRQTTDIKEIMGESLFAGIGLFWLGLLFLYLSKTAKETKGREFRVGDKQPKDLRKYALAMLAMSFLFFFVALFAYFFGKKN